MALDAAQRTILAAHIRANTVPNVVAALAIRNDTELTRLYNLVTSFIVWRSSIQPDEYREVMVWTEVDGLQVGKARIWEWITASMTLPIDATKTNVRQGLADVFPANQSTRGALLAIAKRPATGGESVFATGTGTDANPGIAEFEGMLTTTDIGKALNENP